MPIKMNIECFFEQFNVAICVFVATTTFGTVCGGWRESSGRSAIVSAKKQRGRTMANFRKNYRSRVVCCARHCLHRHDTQSNSRGIYRRIH